MHADIEVLLKMSDRRLWLCAKAPVCSGCGSVQVQLRDAQAQPAEWRCRRCKTEFLYEPTEIRD